MGFTGVYITFFFLFWIKDIVLILDQKHIDRGCSLEPPHQGVSNEIP